MCTQPFEWTTKTAVKDMKHILRWRGNTKDNKRTAVLHMDVGS